MFSSIITSHFFFMFVLIVGLLALILEIFIPSFGLVGITGLYLVLNALGAIPNIENAYYYIIFSILIALILGIILIKFLMSRSSVNKMILHTKLEGTGLDKKTRIEDQEILGMNGEVIKPLRPSGLAQINGKSYQVLSYGEFINKGEHIVVDKIEGNKIYCRRKK